MRRFYKMIFFLVLLILGLSFSSCTIFQSSEDKITVTYQANEGIFSDGKATITKTLKKGSYLDQNLIPTRLDYTFFHWALEETGYNSIDVNTYRVYENITLYAIWNPTTREILKYSSRFHSPTPDSMVDGYFITIGKEETTFDLKNDLFCDSPSTWKIENVEGTIVSNLKPGDNPFTIIVSSEHEARTKNYTINVHRSFDIVITYMEEDRVVFTDHIQSGLVYQIKQDLEAKKEGYQIKEWQKNGYAVDSYIALKDTTLIANLEPKSYEITFDFAGGYESLNPKRTIKYMSTIELPRTRRTGYTFLGWYLGEEYLGQMDSEIQWKYATNASVVAKWEPQQMTLSVKQNLLEAGTVSGGGRAEYDSKLEVRATINPGYTFLGWYEDYPYDQGKFLSNELVYEATVTGTNLIAKYQKFNLNLSANYGEVSYPQTSIVGKPFTIKPALSSLRGFVFDGWYNYTNKVSSELEYEFIMTKDSNMYQAKWINPELEIFDLDVNETECKILGLKSHITTKELYIPSCVTEIKDNAFYKNDSITEVLIEDGVKRIGASAFARCTSLVKVEISGSVIEINPNAFYNCRKLVEVKNMSTCIIEVPTVLHSYSEGESFIKKEDSYLYYIGDNVQYVLGYIGSSSHLELPLDIEGKAYQIFAHAFHGLEFIEKVTIPEKVIGIGEDAFRGCKNLMAIDYFAEDIKSIGRNTFAKEDSLATSKKVKIRIGENVKSIPDNFLYAAGPLDVISIEYLNQSQCTYIGEYAFYGMENLKKIIIPEKVEWIGNQAFNYCYNATEIQYLAKSSAIGTYPFISVGAKSTGVILTIGPLVERIPEKLMSSHQPSSCPNILTCTLEGESLLEIGASAFNGVSTLKSFVIPASVTFIGSNAFSYCTGIQTLEYHAVSLNQTLTSGKNIFNNFSNEEGFTLFIGEKVSSIPAYLFSSIATLKAVRFAEDSHCLQIKEKAFYFTSLEEVVLPNSLEEVEERAFANCTSLKKVTIGTEMQRIHSTAFYDCSNLIEINWNATHAQDGKVFNSIGSGATVVFGRNVMRVPADLFSDSNRLKKMEFETEAITTEIGANAFLNNTELQSILIPRKLIRIESRAFSGCTSLTKCTFEAEEMLDCIETEVFSNSGSTAGFDLYIESEVKRIPAYLFYSTLEEKQTRIRDILFSKKSQCKSIGAYAFASGGNIRTIEFPDSMESIEEGAFSNITAIQNITIGLNTKWIHKDAFKDTSIKNMNWNTNQCPDFTSDTCCFGHITILTIGKDVTRVPAYLTYNNASNILTLRFEEGVCEQIGAYAFYNSHLSQANLPNTIISIEEYAFAKNRLRGVIFPDSVQEVGAYAFSNNQINQVKLSNAMTIIQEGTFQGNSFSSQSAYLIISEKIKEIGAYAFADCIGLSNVTLPNALEEIGAYAFLNCQKLTRIIFPASLMKIGAYAFYKCYNLKNIYFEKNNKPIGEWYAEDVVIDNEILKYETLSATALCQDYVSKVWTYKKR